MLQTNNEKHNTNSVNSNKIIVEANHGRWRHAYSCNDIAFNFSFFWVINAGSLSNGDKKIHYDKWKKTEIRWNYVKNKCHCKVQQKQIHDKKKVVCVPFFLKIVSLCAHNMVAREYLIWSANDFIDHNYHKLKV